MVHINTDQNQNNGKKDHKSRHILYTAYGNVAIASGMIYAVGEESRRKPFSRILIIELIIRQNDNVSVYISISTV